MANRYWVGGTATWDATAGTKWATTSGAAGGAAVPTAADDVFFDTSSSGTCTLSSSSVCRSLDCTGFTGTISHPASTTLTIGDGTAGAGNVALRLVAGMTYTLGNAATSAISFVSTSATQQTITTGGKTLGNWTVNGAGSSYLLSDANTVAISAIVTLTAGTLNTGGQTCSWGAFNATSSGTRTLTLGASSITLTANATAWDMLTTGTLAMNANTSTLTFTGSSVFFRLSGGGPAFNDVIFTNVGGFSTINTLTCANLSIANGASKVHLVNIAGNITVTGTLTVTGNSSINRLLVTSSVVATTRTITAAAVSLSNADFMDIAGAGAASPLTGTSLGDCGGNSGITFDSPTTQTNTGATGNWSDVTKWTSRVPLPQDTVVINTGSGTITADMPRLAKDITFTGFTGTFSTASTANTMYGSVTLASGMTWTGTQAMTLAGRGSHTITSAGKSFPAGCAIWAPGGTYTLQDAFTCLGVFSHGQASGTIPGGTFTTNNFNVTCGGQNSQQTGTTDNWGTSTVTSTNTTGVSFNWTSGAVSSGASAAFVIGVASTSTRTATWGSGPHGAFTYTVPNSPGIINFNLGGAYTVSNITIGSGRIFQIQSGTTLTTSNFNVSGAVNGYVYIPGAATEYPTSPDVAAIRVAGDLDARVDVAMDDWTPAATSCFIGKWSSGATRSWHFRVEPTTGRLSLDWTPDGTNASGILKISSVAPTISDGARLQIRATLDVDNGASGNDVKFYTRASALGLPLSDNTSWTQLGTTQTTAGITSIYAGVGDRLTIANLDAANFITTGKFYEALFMNGINGTVVFDSNFTTKPVGANTFTESSANAATVTINGTLAQAGDGRVSLVSSTPGSPATLTKSTGVVSCDYLSIQDSTATGGAKWYAGANSVNVSGNTGWIFAASNPDNPNANRFFGVFE